MLGLGGVACLRKQFEKLRARFTQLSPCGRCESILALPSWVVWLLLTSSRLGAATAPPAAPFFLLMMSSTDQGRRSRGSDLIGVGRRESNRCHR